MNIKLVKFSNGKYGVRKGLIFYKYLDFESKPENKRYWWDKDHYSFSRVCMTDELEAREEMFVVKTQSYINKIKEIVIE